MNRFSTGLRAKQSGFTMIELVIVMIIIGILAAVATIKFNNVTDAANRAANKAILGMVKSAWTAAYAVNKAQPDLAQVAEQTGDPVCTATATGVSCPAAWTSPNGTGPLLISIPNLAAASSMVCATPADCD